LNGNLQVLVEGHIENPRSKTMSKTKATLSFTAIAVAAALALGSQIAVANEHSEDAAKSPDSEQPVTDTWITTKVKSTLLATEGVAGSDINVTTVDGVVTLAGVLDTRHRSTRPLKSLVASKALSVSTRAR
jgi:hyperosmotically inducible protein